MREAELPRIWGAHRGSDGWCVRTMRPGLSVNLDLIFSTYIAP